MRVAVFSTKPYDEKLIAEIEQILKRGVLKVGMDTFQPWAMKDKNGTPGLTIAMKHGGSIDLHPALFNARHLHFINIDYVLMGKAFD